MKNLIRIAVVSAALVFVATFASQAGPGSDIPGVCGIKRGSNPDLARVIPSAGLNALGGGNVKPDPVLGEVFTIGYAFKNHVGNMINNSTSSASSDYVYSFEGFNKLYMDNSGVGRIYYRVYSAEHGWSAWCTAGENTNTNDDGAKVQAIQIRHKGYMANLTDVYYKTVLSDGTVLDWAKNGQTSGTMGTDRYIVALAVTLWDKNTKAPVTARKVMCANAYEGMYVDRDGNRKYSTFDGRPYTGWAYESGNGQYYFINGTLARGWQYLNGYKYYFGDDGCVVSNLEPLIGLQSQYQIRYNKGTRSMYVMAFDPDTQSFCIPFKVFMTSCGPDTPIGTFDTYERYDWKYMHASEDGAGDIYCQKLTRFKNSFLMHSLLYFKEANPFNFAATNYNYIDYAISGGCIRLCAGDANWIYTNIPLHTPVIIYEDPWDKGPIEKPAVDQAISTEQNYDPTDPIALEALAAGTEVSLKIDPAAVADADQAAGN